jgi:cation:H+ antiporter
MLIAILQLVGGLVLLVFGADRFVLAAARIARSLRIAPLVIGLVVVGTATSMPEVLVGSVAAWNGRISLAVGNAVGSNIANLGLVLGCTLLVRPLRIESAALRREYWAAFAAAVIACALLADGHLGRGDGLVLLAVMAGLTGWVLYCALRTPRSDPLAREFAHTMQSRAPLPASIVMLVSGLLLLLAGAELLVHGAVTVARAAGVSDLVIGLTVVAVGTSVPELAASIMSAIRNEADIAIGNVIGSNMFNMAIVLGIPALIQPGRVGDGVLSRDFPVMFLMTLALGWLLLRARSVQLGRGTGAAFAAVFILYQFALSQAGR